EHGGGGGQDSVWGVIEKASDGFLFDTQAISVPVTNAAESNTPPVIPSNGGNASAALSVAENTTAVTTVTATDADGDLLSYTLSGGHDQSKFQINPSTAPLSFITPPNFQPP